jgi:hypothetical protein
MKASVSNPEQDYMQGKCATDRHAREADTANARVARRAAIDHRQRL